MQGLLPPSSSVTGVRFLLARSMTSLPTGTLPVKKILSQHSSSSASFSARPPSTTVTKRGSNASSQICLSTALDAGA